MPSRQVPFGLRAGHQKHRVAVAATLSANQLPPFVGGV
jgi:hypothetical protein